MASKSLTGHWCEVEWNCHFSSGWILNTSLPSGCEPNKCQSEGLWNCVLESVLNCMINSRLVLSVWAHFLLTCFLAFILVFDDGDERTLRRTSLCLKGERHFAESEVRWTSTESWVVECYFFFCIRNSKLILFPLCSRRHSISCH